MAYFDPDGEFPALIPILIVAIPAVVSFSAFVATQPTLTGMIGNVFMNHPVESSIRSTPVIGDLIDAGEAISGKDVFTNNPLSPTDRIISGGAAIVPFVAGGVMRSGLKGIDGWGNPRNIEDHFKRHGADFGAKSPKDYAKMANEWINNAKNNPNVDSFVGRDGYARYYDQQNNILGSVNRDNKIATFFKPDPNIHRQPTNLDYWNEVKERYGRVE